jgi:hypothetical protein
MVPPNIELNSIMARKTQSVPDGFVLFDVVYEDGTLSSNRRVARAQIDQLDADASAQAAIEAQDRKIAEMSGRPLVPIKSVTRSGSRQRGAPPAASR